MNDSLFAATQLIATLHRTRSRTQIPVTILAELLWLDATELHELYGPEMTASHAVEFLRYTQRPNHIIFDILNGSGRHV